MKIITIKIGNVITYDILNMRLIDTYCKHVIRNNNSNKGKSKSKSERLYKESVKLGYDICEWGLYNGRPNDIEFHLNKIRKMEEDNYNHALRIIICKYDFRSEPVVWVDNIHSAVMYIRKYGESILLKDVPFYVIDTIDKDHVLVNGYKDNLRDSNEDIMGAISCAYKRFRRSNSKALIDIGYTLNDFLNDNPVLLEK